MLTDKDIFGPNCDWKMPEECPLGKGHYYKMIEKEFERLKQRGQLAPLIDHVDSVYLKCTYHGGFHTSRTFTKYSEPQGIFDHIIYDNT